MRLEDISAEVIFRPGGLGDASYPALEIRWKDFSSPYALTLALPVVVYRALSEQIDPMILYDAIASAVNQTHVSASVKVEASSDHNKMRAL